MASSAAYLGPARNAEFCVERIDHTRHNRGTIYCPTGDGPYSEHHALGKMQNYRYSGDAERQLLDALTESRKPGNNAFYVLQAALAHTDHQLKTGRMKAPPPILDEVRAEFAACERFPWHQRYRWNALPWNECRASPGSDRSTFGGAPGSVPTATEVDTDTDARSVGHLPPTVPLRCDLLQQNLRSSMCTERVDPIGICGGPQNYHADNRGTLPRHRPLPDSLVLTFCDFDTKKHSIRVEPATTTVAALKQTLFEHTGILPAEQRIFNKGERLFSGTPEEEATTTLTSCGLCNDADFFLLLP